MSFKSLIRRVALWIISQPKSHVYINLQQVDYNGLLKGQNIIVTGGSKGIGFAMAQKFVSEGAKVLITGRNENSLAVAVQQLGRNSSYIVFDNSNIDEISQFWNRCINQLNGVDSLVLNAGISLHEGSFLNVTDEGYNKQFDINLKSNYFLAQTFLKYKLQKQQEGSLLFLSSETAGKSIDIPYGLTKVAINSLVGALARRVYQKGIRVNAIAPGVTLTDMIKNIRSNDDDFSNDSAAGRYLLSSEIAEVATFILGNVSRCITGEVIYCDAGSHLKINGIESEYSL